MRKYEPKDFGLLDWIHYTWDLLVLAVLWVTMMTFWTSVAGSFGLLLTLVSGVIVLALADKVAHYVALPFLAKLMKK